MTDPKDSHGDEHIEDLLSQLQGIFGRLSSLDPPASASTPTDAPQESASNPPSPPTIPAQSAEPIPAKAAPPPAAAPASEPAAFALPTAPATPEDLSALSAAIYYPIGREAEAKTFAQKLETLTPKFTKVAFHLRIASLTPYDPKNEWRNALLAKAAAGEGLRAIFLVIGRPLEEAKRKPLVSQLESKGVYFQDVPFLSIEKKAFYTDLLLGLVFFFDTLKSSSSENA